MAPGGRIAQLVVVTGRGLVPPAVSGGEASPYRLVRLPGGARLMSIPMEGRASVAIAFRFAVGSRYEDESRSGLAHFLEHMLFKGGRRYPTARALSEEIERAGGVLNAGTDHEETVFWARVPAGRLEVAGEVLADMLFEPVIGEEEVTKERHVVVEELRGYADNPQEHVHVLFDELMWPDHPLGRDVAGREETVMGFRREDCLAHLEEHYRPDRLVVTVAGGVGHEEAAGLVGPIVDRLARRGGGGDGPPAAEALEGGRRVRLLGRDIEQANIVVGGRSSSYLDPDRFAVDLLTTVLGEGMSSRLFLEVRERRALAYDVHALVSRVRDSGYLAVYLGCEPERAEEAVGAVVGEIDRLASAEVADEELDRAKEYAKGRLVMGLEGTSAFGEFFGQQELLTGNVLLPEEVVRRIDGVTAVEVAAAARRAVEGGLRAAVIGPFEGGEAFERVLPGTGG